MRLRTRLAISLIAAHLLLTTVVGWGAWRWVDASLREQAEASARAVGRVLAGGGFSADERVLARMRQLSGHDFRLLDAAAPARAGAVQVVEAGVGIEVDYRTPRYAAARHLLLGATLAVAALGTLAFAAVAWLIARRFARPIEALGAAARGLASACASAGAAFPALPGEKINLANSIPAAMATGTISSHFSQLFPPSSSCSSIKPSCRACRKYRQNLI